MSMEDHKGNQELWNLEEETRNLVTKEDLDFSKKEDREKVTTLLKKQADKIIIAMKEHNKDMRRLFLLSVLVGFIYAIFSYVEMPPALKTALEIGWNPILGGALIFVFYPEMAKREFKTVSFKWFFMGYCLVYTASMAGTLLYANIAGEMPNPNAVNGSITWIFVIFQMPFMLLGEELITTNLLSALMNMNPKASFWLSSLIASLWFAAWHIPAYGPHVGQLLLTLVPARLALNYIWNKSESLWASWACHLLFDFMAFLPILLK